MSFHYSIDSQKSMILLTGLAVDCGQNLEKVAFKDQSWLGLKTRSRKYKFSARNL